MTNTKIPQTHPAHPFADLFPLASPEDASELIASMLARGYDPQEPIVLHKGRVLDGRNRQAAIVAAIERDAPERHGRRPHPLWPVYATFKGDDRQALEYVVSKNLARRHLTVSQRIMVAARLVTSTHGGNNRTTSKAPVVTQYAAAAALRVSERSVRAAVKLIAEDPAKADAIAGGRGTVNARTGDSDEYYTPSDVMTRVRGAFRGRSIDLDPASCAEANRTVCAAKYYDAKHDGLSLPWKPAHTVFLNPPYSNPSPWVDRLLDYVRENEKASAILLTHNCTDQEWWHAASTFADATCFLNERVSFLRPGGAAAKSPRQGSCLWYFAGEGDDASGFLQAFSEVGLVMVPHMESPVLRAVQAAQLPLVGRAR